MIVINTSCDSGQWDEYVASHDDASFSHYSAWCKTLAEIYGLTPFILCARYPENVDRIGGILPLVLFAPPNREKRLISLPYTDAAGVVADTSMIATALVKEALNLAQEVGADHLEIRQNEQDMPLICALPDLKNGVFHTGFDFKTGLSRDLPASEAELWQNLGPKVRNQIRKARKKGCKATVGGVERLDAFFEVFSQNMRDLGSPVHDKTLFKRLAQTFKTAMRFIVITINGRPAAAAVVFVKKSVMVNPWASSLRPFRPDCPNMLLYWTMLCSAIDLGCRRFDFGRSSPGAGTCRFKQQWGAKKTKLIWHVFSPEHQPWDPECENLVHEKVMALSLGASQKKGPLMRKWISL